MYIKIDENLCVRCEACLSVCPNNVISTCDGVVCISNLENCDFCGQCVDSCPVDAIIMGE